VRDPAASLSLFAIDFTMGGRDFTLPAHPAARWLEVLLANDLSLLVTAEPEGLIDPDSSYAIDVMLLDGSVDMDDYRGALFDVLGAVAGRDWWEAVGLVGAVAVESNWSRINGQLVRAGIDAGEVPLAAWLDAALSLCTEHMDEKQLGRFLGHLQTPPVEVGIDEEREGASFLSMLNAQ
jgi:hypothetical protein